MYVLTSKDFLQAVILSFYLSVVIQQHNVIFWDNPFLCHFQFTVDINSLFANPSKQRRILVNKNDTISSYGCDYGKYNLHVIFVYSCFISVTSWLYVRLFVLCECSLSHFVLLYTTLRWQFYSAS